LVLLMEPEYPIMCERMRAGATGNLGIGYTGQGWANLNVKFSSDKARMRGFRFGWRSDPLLNQFEGYIITEITVSLGLDEPIARILRVIDPELMTWIVTKRLLFECCLFRENLKHTRQAWRPEGYMCIFDKHTACRISAERY
jgi:hypothetical protein